MECLDDLVVSLRADVAVLKRELAAVRRELAALRGEKQISLCLTDYMELYSAVSDLPLSCLTERAVSFYKDEWYGVPELLINGTPTFSVDFLEEFKSQLFGGV